MDRAAAKLLKNRESARKARLRKNLYIELLEDQVEMLNKEEAEGKLMEKQSAGYLEELIK